MSGDHPPTTFSPPRGPISSAPYSALQQPAVYGVGSSDRPLASSNALRSSASAYSAQRQSLNQTDGPEGGERRHTLWWQQQREAERQGGPQAVRNLSAPTPSFGFQPAALMHRLTQGSPGSSPGTTGRRRGEELQGDGGGAGQQQQRWVSRSGIDAGGRPVRAAAGAASQPAAVAWDAEGRWAVRPPVAADSPHWEAPRGDAPLTAPRTQPPLRQPAAFPSDPRASAGSGAGAGGGAAGGTSDLIESLVRRYTEAQSFLAHIRQSQ